MTEGINGFSSPRAEVFPAGLRVLVVDDDPTWLKILEKMLRKCSYEVTTCGLAIEALDLLRERKDGFDIVISDVNMPDMDGFKLLEHVGLEMDLPVIMMSVDGETSRVMRGVQHGACDYLLKPIRMKELRNIWQHVYRKKIHEVRDTEGLEEILTMRNVSEQSDDGYLLCGGDFKKRKDNKYDDKDFADHSSIKKQRVVWTVDLHQKFVKAVNLIGFEKVGPKKILDLMNVPWLTRENVASHLQKYRLYLTRLQKDDLKASSSGPKNPDFSPPGAHTDPIKMQQTETNNNLRIPANSKCTASLQTTESKKILTGYAAATSFESTQYPTFNPVLPTQYSWNGGFREIQFKQEHKHNPQFQVENGFTNHGLPPQQVQSKKRDNPATPFIPTFQPPDPVTSSTWNDQSLEKTCINNNQELSAFSLPAQHTNLDMDYNDPNLYDALRFDYEYPPDSLEYPVIDQGLFIV